MAGTYAWLQYSTARQQLAQRLSDSGNVFWSDAECGLYICEALRIFNCLAWTWKADFQYNSSQLWNSLAALTGSPRLRTIKDTDVYTFMEYQLLEPPTGGTWTGTSQFTIQNLSQALQRRRDEILQVSDCNDALLANLNAVVGQRRTQLADTVIDLKRLRWIAATQTPPSPTPAPVTLVRDDMLGMDSYNPGIYQTPNGTPSAFMVSAEPPLAFDVDVAPNLPGNYEAIALQSGAAFAPPASTLLGIPNDYAWVARMGALADLLGMEGEATDRERSTYCAKRYVDGLKLMLNAPWVMLANINQVPVPIESLKDMDAYNPEWDSNPGGFDPVLVLAGMDFIAAPTNTGVLLTVLGNAPVPVADADYVQVSRSNWDTVLDLAQSMAVFKMGGAEFKAALELEAKAIQACGAENTRLRSMGLFSDVLAQRAQIQDRTQERYSAAGEGR